MDFNEVFFPIVKHTSICALLAIVALFDFELDQVNVKIAFLHGDLEEQIYMDQLEGFQVQGKENYVCKLKKLLYSLKQSPRQWYQCFDTVMASQGYTQSEYDILFISEGLQMGHFIYLLLHVDDMIIASKSMYEINELKA